MRHLRILKRKPNYLTVVAALFISGIGTAFTSVAVYSELAFRQSHPTLYTLAFILGLAPAVISSQVAGMYLTRFSATRWFGLMQMIAAIMLLPAIFGSKSIALLLSAEAISSFVGGLIMPAYRYMERQSFKDDELPTAAVLDVFIFSLNFIFGQGLGALLYPLMGTQLFLIIDLMSYVLAAVIIFLSNDISYSSAETKESSTFNYSQLTSLQRRALWLYPFLSFICGSLMSILPFKATQYDPSIKIIFLSPVLLLISSRTLGQMVGPFVIRGEKFMTLLKDTRFIPFCLTLFIVLYGITFNIHSLVLSAVLIVLAHIFSNIVYTVANFAITRCFDSSNITMAAARNYQFGILSLILGSTGTALLTAQFGMNGALGLSISGLGVYLYLFRKWRI